MDAETFIRTYFPTINASLNLLATVLLVVAWVQIKRARELAHRRTMLAAFGVSVAFLACYLVYHAVALHVPFSGEGPVRYLYFAILITHIILAAAVPFLAVTSIVLGLLDRRLAHRRLSRWTYPIWLYVSVTGVVIYLMLYVLYPPAATTATLL